MSLSTADNLGVNRLNGPEPDPGPEIDLLSLWTEQTRLCVAPPVETGSAFNEQCRHLTWASQSHVLRIAS